MIAIIFYFSALMAILSGSMLLPILVAFGSEEMEVGLRLLQYAGVGVFVSITTLFAIFGRVGSLNRNHAIFLALLVWVSFPIITALPLMDILDMSLTNALFQTMSCYTTTGSIILANSEAVPRSIIFLFAQLEWLGGLVTLITLVLFFAPWGIGGLPQVSGVSVAASLIITQSRLVKYCAQIFRIYLLLTLLCFIFLSISKVSPYDASILSFTALSTGGIVPSVESLDLLLGDGGMVIMAVFLIIGATSVFWHQAIATLNFDELREHRESYYVIEAWIILALLVCYYLMSASGTSGLLSFGKSFSEGLFNSASIISTSGIQSRPGVFALFPPTLVLLIVFIGAGCFSTAGGIKFYRIGGMFSLSRHELNRLIYPSSVKPSKFGNTEFDLKIMKSIWSLFAISIVLVGVASLILSLYGLDFQQSVTAAIAATTNTGPLFNPDWISETGQAWPLYGELHPAQIQILTLVMLLGRLEVIAIIACLTLFFRV